MQRTPSVVDASENLRGRVRWGSEPFHNASRAVAEKFAMTTDLCALAARGQLKQRICAPDAKSSVREKEEAF